MDSPADALTIAICGAGPVGMVLAALLVGRGMAPERIVLIDGRSAGQAADDPRSIALSWGSRQLLESIGAWPIAADPIEQIHVSRRGHFGRMLIDRADHGLPALGYVTRYGTLVSALHALVAQHGIAVERPAQVVSISEDNAGVQVHLADGKTVGATIAVQAEGGVYGTQPARQPVRDYDQTAIIAQVAVDRPQKHQAFERFTDEGPLALLPQDGGYSLVWCVRPATSLQLLALDDTGFLAALQQAFGERLGRFTATGQRRAYPLGLTVAPPPSARTVFIGNAAQTLHPVAGQGLNLGLRDAAVLASLVARDPSPAMLARFAAERRSDRGLTIRLTDAMARAFSSAPAGALSQGVLGAALALTDLLPPARKRFADQMMFGWR